MKEKTIYQFVQYMHIHNIGYVRRAYDIVFYIEKTRQRKRPKHKIFLALLPFSKRLLTVYSNNFRRAIVLCVYIKATERENDRKRAKLDASSSCAQRARDLIARAFDAIKSAPSKAKQFDRSLFVKSCLGPRLFVVQTNSKSNTRPKKPETFVLFGKICMVFWQQIQNWLLCWS